MLILADPSDTPPTYPAQPYRKAAIPAAERRAVALRHGAEPGGPSVRVRCHWCWRHGSVRFTSRTWPAFSYLEMDHVIPEFLGGPSVASNLVLACQTCNRSKGTRVWTSAA